MDISILIVSWNTREDLLRCLASVYADTIDHAFEVIVVDNNSSDGTAEGVTTGFPAVRLITNDMNLGFARANNQAVSHAHGHYWLLLNPDTVLRPGAVNRMVAHLRQHPLVAAVGPRLLNPDGSLQPSIERLPTLFSEWWRLAQLDRLLPVSHYSKQVLTASAPRPVEVLNGACLLVRRDAVGQAPLFDEDYFVYSEEVDLCDRFRQAGWALHWLPTAAVIHRGGQSTRQVADRMFLELYGNKLKFFRKRRGALAARLYKLVLLQTALSRWVAGKALARLSSARRADGQRLSRQYHLLLVALRRL